MPFDWKHYLDLARDLAQPSASGQGQREAELRSAISRAYYAAFCHARNYSRDWLNFQPTNTADDHGRLKAHLKDGKRRGLAVKLDQLQHWRNAADYEDSWMADLATVANTTISETQRVLDLLPLPTNPSVRPSA